MLNKIFPLALFFITFVTMNSCRHDEEAVIDCLGESVLVSLKHEVSDTNTRQINFEVNYSGDKTVTSVNWDFGDGTSQQQVQKTPLILMRIKELMK